MDDLPTAVVASRDEERSATDAAVGIPGAVAEAPVKRSVVPGKTALLFSVTAEISATAAASAPGAKPILECHQCSDMQQSSLSALALPVCTCRTGSSETAELAAGEEVGEFVDSACGCSGGKSKSRN